MAEEQPECCKGCARWNTHGKECWVYWENKKNCTQHSDIVGDVNF